MSKKLFIGLVPLVVTAAVAVMPVAAQAEPHWYRNGVIIKEGKRVQTVTWGKLTFNTPVGVIICKWTDAHELYNPVGGGRGLDESFLYDAYECSAPGCPAIIRVKFEKRWLTGLVPVEPGKIGDQMTEGAVRLTCYVPASEKEEEKVLSSALFSGELTPVFKNGTSATKPSAEEFSPASGMLTSEIGPATVEGTDKMMGFEAQEVIAVKDP